MEDKELQAITKKNVSKIGMHGSTRIKYRVIDTRTGEVKGLWESYESAEKHANKLEPGGKYVMSVEKVKTGTFRKKRKSKPKSKSMFGIKLPEVKW